MRYACVFLVLFIVSACSQPQLEVNTIVERAFDAHGKDLWGSMNTLSYEKESRVYNADGTIRVQTLQYHDYHFQPDFSAQVRWNADGESHEITYSAGSATKTVKGEQVTDQEVLASATASVNAALYTVSQPFKLTDPGVMLTYEGVDMLEEGEEVHVVKASYSTENENHTKNDAWWYYFDVDTYLCRATMVHHGTTYSYIKNLAYDRSSGIVLNAHRKGYAVDSTRKILYHQSEYFYRGYKVLPEGR